MQGESRRDKTKPLTEKKWDDEEEEGGGGRKGAQNEMKSGK